MHYQLGNSKHMLDLGQTQEQTCPKCEKDGVFPVYKNLKLEFTAQAPFFDGDSVYFTFCPNCQQCFTVPHSMGVAYEKGDDWAIRSQQFEMPKPYKK